MYTFTMDNEIVVANGGATLAVAGEVANHYARRNVFADYQERKADNTLRAQVVDLGVFADFLRSAQLATTAEELRAEPTAWAGVTWGLVEAFRNWQVQHGAAMATINRRLSTVKKYAGLAAKAGAIDPQEAMLIRAVQGYGGKEAKRVDERRPVTRVGAKKAEHVAITAAQAKQLKTQPDTPQGRRDALIMALLLDHGLRVGELAGLQVTDFDLATGMMAFYRPKVDKEQNHKMTADTLRAVAVWLHSGDAPAMGPLLRGSRKGGELTDAGMSERAITARVGVLGAAVGIVGLSAHDCRHYWATHWAGKVDLFRLQEAGGWNSLAMPRRYTEWAAVANEGMA